MRSDGTWVAARWVSMLLVCTSITRVGAAQAQSAVADTYPTFTNSVTAGASDPGVAWIAGATSTGHLRGQNSIAGLYIGGASGGPFQIYASPRLEDLFLDPEPFNMEAQDDTFRGRKVAGKYVCNIGGSPSFTTWNNNLYVSYGIGPSDPPAGAAQSVKNAYASACAVSNSDPDSRKNPVVSPILIMRNSDPKDPFCERHGAKSVDPQNAQLQCWHAINYDPNHPDSRNNNPFPGRAVSFLIRARGTPNQSLWAFYTNGGTRVVKMVNPGQPHDDIVLTSDKIVTIGESIETPTTAAGYTSFSDYEKHNFRTYEFRHNKNAPDGTQGANEGPQPFVTNVGGKERVFLTYSANSAQFGADYLLGLMEFKGTAGDELDASGSGTGPANTSTLWVKARTPAFQGAPAVPDLAETEAYKYRQTGYVDKRSPSPDFQDGVCGTGTNSIVKSPDGSELWNVYVGRYDCVARKRLASDDKNHALADYNLDASTVRTLRLQKVMIDSNGYPNFGTPWADGELHARPKGEDATRKPFQTLADASSMSYDITDHRVFAVGLQSDPTDQSRSFLGALSANNVNNYGKYFLVDFVGSNIRIDGLTGNDCIISTGTTDDPQTEMAKCGKIKVIADGKLGDPDNVVTIDVSKRSDGILFDSAKDSLTGLNTAGRHTLLVQVTGDGEFSSDGYRLASGPIGFTKVTIQP